MVPVRALENFPAAFEFPDILDGYSPDLAFANELAEPD
jgi:hypothetical protein